MLESLNIIIDETFEIYSLATLDGKLFIPFFICLAYILLVPAKEDERARKYLVYPSLVLMFFLFNPVLIHLLYKYIEVPERIVRMYWPLPMDILFVYCLMRFFDFLGSRWKKALLLLFAAALLYISTGGSHTGQSYTRAHNTEKMPKGTKEVCDTLLVLSEYQDPYVMLPDDLFFWTREYNPYIRIPYARDMDEMRTEDGAMDLDVIGPAALEGGCRFVVLMSSVPTAGELENHGFELASTIAGQDCEYYIYMLI